MRAAFQHYRTIVVLAVVCGIVGAVAAYLVASNLPKTYEARSVLVAATAGDTFADLAQSRTVLERVASTLHIPDSVDSLAGQVVGQASKTSSLLTIIVQNADPDRAAQIANAIAAELVKLAPAVTGYSQDAGAEIAADLSTVHDEISRTEAAIAAAPQSALPALQSQLTTLLSARASLLSLQLSYAPTSVSVVSDAIAPTGPTSPKPSTAVLFGAAAGLAVGIAYGLVLLAMAGGQKRDATSDFREPAVGSASEARG